MGSYIILKVFVIFTTFISVRVLSLHPVTPSNLFWDISPFVGPVETHWETCLEESVGGM